MFNLIVDWSVKQRLFVLAASLLIVFYGGLTAQ